MGGRPLSESQDIELQTTSGDMVGVFVMPIFLIDPMVLCWGSRFFLRHRSREMAPPGQRAIYRETSIWYLTANAVPPF